MGESIPVKVTLGGPIREGTIGPLVDAMMGDGLFAGGDESACEASHLEAAIRAAATRGEVVSFDNYAASYGSADETEAVCAEHQDHPRYELRLRRAVAKCESELRAIESDQERMRRREGAADPRATPAAAGGGGRQATLLAHR